jgi:hypothetical protein
VERLGRGVDDVKKNLILILEDNAKRIENFQRAAMQIQSRPVIKVWHDVQTMIAELKMFLSETALVSLDHDLNPQPGVERDPGTGLEVAKFMAKLPPACPVILHSSNFERVWSMHNELTHAGWQVERVGPIGQDWIKTSWLNKVQNLLPENK